VPRLQRFSAAGAIGRRIRIPHHDEIARRMRIGIPREIHAGERRVAATPDSVRELIKLGFTVGVETGAGDAAHFTDDSYREAGAEVMPDAAGVWKSAEIVLKVRPPEPIVGGAHEADLLRDGATLIAFIWPAQNAPLLARLAARRATVLAMDTVPRISRAQKLDALSSMANIAGYRAVIEAANHFGRFFTGQVTAAGKVPPAKVMVIGAGVAGLAAIGAATGLGAIVRAFDTRPEVKDQVKSMGGQFLTVNIEEEGTGQGGYAKVMSEAYIKAEMELFAAQAREVDIIITTALVPGKPAPKLITDAMIRSMPRGSVIVDLAAEQGGNTELTVPGEVVVRHGVTIIGYTDLPSRLPTQSSRLYATNVRNLIAELATAKDGTLVINMDDEVIRGATVVKEGAITWPPPPAAVVTQTRKPVAGTPVVNTAIAAGKTPGTGWAPIIGLVVGTAAVLGIGAVAPASFLTHFTVFVLACFIGYKVVWSVTPSLHTPLMSVTNAISGIIVIGALLEVSGPMTSPVTILAIVAILISTINIAGGFLVTQRMLKLFQK
jgi:NAD(P) transhydrogenase subunit alpha